MTSAAIAMRSVIGARRMPVYLGFVAGMVDVTGWLTLGGLFTAHITGNLVVIAADAVDGRSIHPAQVLAVPVFIGVAALIGIAVRLLALPAPRMMKLLFASQSILLLIAAIVAIWASPSLRPSGAWATLVAMLAVAAMSSQNALLHLSAQHAPSTAVMTGNVIVATLSLVSIVMHRAGDEAESRAQWRATWPIILGFMAGCAVGSAAVLLSHDGAWLGIALVSVALAVGLWRSSPAALAT